MSNDIHAQLYKVQQALNAPKNQLNKFGGYRYRSCEDILEAVKKILPANSTVTISDEIKMIGDRYYVQVTASFNFEGNSIQSTALAREPSEKKGYDASQITGAASSYARKYALNGLFAIDDAKDDDSTNTNGKNEYSANEKRQKENKDTKSYNELYKYFKSNDKLNAYKVLSKMSREDKKTIMQDCSDEMVTWLTTVSKNPQNINYIPGEEYARV